MRGLAVNAALRLLDDDVDLERVELADYPLGRVVRAADALAYGDVDDPFVRMLRLHECDDLAARIDAHYAHVMDLLGGEPPTASREALVALLEASWVLELEKIVDVRADAFAQLAVDALVQLYPLEGCARSFTTRVDDADSLFERAAARFARGITSVS